MLAATMRLCSPAKLMTSIFVALEIARTCTCCCVYAGVYVYPCVSELLRKCLRTCVSASMPGSVLLNGLFLFARMYVHISEYA